MYSSIHLTMRRATFRKVPEPGRSETKREKKNDRIFLLPLLSLRSCFSTFPQRALKVNTGTEESGFVDGQQRANNRARPK